MNARFIGAAILAVAGSLGILSNTPAADESKDVTQHNVFRASILQGMQIRDSQDNKLGTIKDVVIDLQASGAPFVGLSISGIKGYVAVPLSVLELKLDSNKQRNFFTLNASADQLKTAPQLTSNDWHELRTPQFVSDVHRFFKPMQRTTARPTEENR